MGRAVRHFSAGALAMISMAGVAHAQICSVEITNMDFGNVDVLAGAPIDVSGMAKVTCLKDALRKLACLSIGSGSGGFASGTRQMRNAANDSLPFDLYQDPARTLRFGSAFRPELGSPVAVLFPTGAGNTTINVPIYARIPPNQQGTRLGSYASEFSAEHVALVTTNYTGTPPNCSTIQGSPKRGPFSVRAGVLKNCKIRAQNLDFGEHGILDSAVDATGQLSVTCSPGTSFSVGLDHGLNGSGPTSRRMMLGERSIMYGLYRDPARTQPWGGVTSSNRFSGTGSGAEQKLPIYGRVPAQLAPGPGKYTDTVVVTVSY